MFAANLSNWRLIGFLWGLLHADREGVLEGVMLDPVREKRRQNARTKCGPSNIVRHRVGRLVAVDRNMLLSDQCKQSSMSTLLPHFSEYDLVSSVIGLRQNHNRGFVI